MFKNENDAFAFGPVVRELEYIEHLFDEITWVGFDRSDKEGDLSMKKIKSERIKILTESDDGFIISEKDLQLRGSGQLIGTRQHGFSDFEFTDLAEDIDIIINARNEAEKTISAIPDIEEELDNIRHKRFSRQLKGLRHKRILSLLS